MILRCTISYTTPDGQTFNAGELVEVAAELGMWLLAAAAGQFKVVETQDIASVLPDDGLLVNPPADMAKKGGRRKDEG